MAENLTPSAAASGVAERPGTPETVDVAVNIFAKPFQTALSLLSLLKHSGEHVGVIWLQFEPYGSRYDAIAPYYIAHYLRERLGERCRVFQPDFWLAREAVDPARLGDAAYRSGIRYQYAFERSQSRKLFLMHNDVLVLRDILGAMLREMGEAFAVGLLGQCWNCPAHREELTREVMGCAACGPLSYADFQPGYAALRSLYTLARQRGIFVRPYDKGFADIFERRPWPLPECRINEWACLLDLEKTRPHCAPFGPSFPPGAFQQCGSACLDISVPWFRDMHALGLSARHFELQSYLKHWVGTGNKSPRRYALAEANALKLLRRHYPEYLQWLAEKSGQVFLSEPKDSDD
ncbi:hypothetical protein [uncultured Desulfovibrio sp.]|uniref:hypothetical protein n=1 Tax=uncultured Desulfovibrio sp. TaxID=167968 RepID=UPI00258FC6B2|nr:hypothetical protein [uncultured Desulfovibrio sp.]